MDYNKLLGNYDRILIRFDSNILKLMKETDGILINYLDEDIRELFRIMEKNPSSNNGIFLEISRDGFRLNTETLKKELCSNFDITYDSNLINNIRSKIQLLTMRKQELDDKMYTSFTDVDNKKEKKYLLGLFYQTSYIRKEIKKLDKFYSFSKNEKEHRLDCELFNENKLELYIAYDMFLKSLKSDGEDCDKLEYLKNYIINNINNFKDFSNMDKDKVKEIIDYINNLEKKKINNNKQYNYSFFESDESISRDTYNRMCSMGMNGDNSIELKALLQRKMDYYESLNYVGLLIGKDTFNGYIGFRLDNGMIILDKFFKNKKGSISNEDAIYVINDENDFEDITKMSKTKAISAIKEESINAFRRIHRGNFEEKISSYIEEVNNKHSSKTN